VLKKFRLVLTFIALALSALWLTAPAAAWSAHDVAHFGNPVDVAEHHHHDAQSADVPDPGSPADQDQDSGGHDHMPSNSAGFSALLTTAATLLPAVDARALPKPAVARGLAEITEPPPARPPRTI